MAAPQITTVTPSEGLASGRQLVTVRGSRFKVQAPGDPIPVRVRFDGVEADQVIPMADYRIDCVVPQYRGSPASIPAAVSVEVANLDAAGDPIAGETTVASGAFTYRRERLAPEYIGDTSAESQLDTVNRALYAMLRSSLVNEVAPATDPDWSDDPSSGLTSVAQLPCILLDGPEVSESLLYRYEERQRASASGALIENGETYTHTHPFTAICTWSIVLVAERKYEAVRLLNATIRLFNRRPYLQYAAFPGSDDLVRSDLFVRGAWTTEDRPEDRVYSYRSEIAVEPVYLDDDYGVASTGIPVEDVTSVSTQDNDEFLSLEESTHE
jgi:hypothetical protein